MSQNLSSAAGMIAALRFKLESSLSPVVQSLNTASF